MKKVLSIILILHLSLVQANDWTLKHSPYDLTVVGTINWRHSLPRTLISLVRTLKKDISINSISTSTDNFDEIPNDEQLIYKNNDKRPGKVAILFDILWEPSRTPADYVPDSYIKIAYTMLEGTAIPERWAELINKRFDAVVVPDKYYVKVYEKSGVKKPIFVQPHGVSIENLLNIPVRKTPSKYFVFGTSAFFIPRKNHNLLLDAFQAEFGRNPRVHLKIHGSGGDYGLEDIRRKISGYPNISLMTNSFSTQDYENFLRSLDCYVLLSKGEGFSITPREALALGKPCILSCNTAHQTICEAGFALGVPSNIQERALYPGLGGYYGYNFNCNVDDVRKALREVNTNYQTYANKAEQGREWVKRYLWPNLRGNFLTLIKPKEVIRGKENSIRNGSIVTNSDALYKKYKRLIKYSKK